MDSQADSREAAQISGSTESSVQQSRDCVAHVQIDVKVCCSLRVQNMTGSYLIKAEALALPTTSLSAHLSVPSLNTSAGTTARSGVNHLPACLAGTFISKGWSGAGVHYRSWKVGLDSEQSVA